MKIRFCGQTTIYDMDAAISEPGLVQLYPPLPDVDFRAGFELLTERGTVFGDYSGYTTLYRELEDGSVILSEGRTYVPPDPEPEPYIPTLEEIRNAKRKEVSSACEQMIYAGIAVALSGGVEYFSLTEKDQINLFGKQAQLAAGAEQLEYHQDGHPCRYYTAAEMQRIIKAAMEHVSYHTTYCNSLHMWIAGAETAEEVEGIYYGADIPEEYQSEVLKDYLARIMAPAAEALEEAEEAEHEEMA